MQKRRKRSWDFEPKGERSQGAGKDTKVREAPAHYNVFLEAENEDIGPENTYFWDLNL
jgi:hypothetical protein